MSDRFKYRDRCHAGEVLARELASLAGEDLRVLAIPRGGVLVAAEIAHSLNAPLDVLVVRTMGVPSNPLSSWACSIPAGWFCSITA